MPSGERPRPSRQRRPRRLVLGLVLATLLGAAALVRPVRVVWPQAVGLHCHGPVCVDDDARSATAQALFTAAFAADERVLGPAPTPARVVFCSTATCYARFGADHSTARTIGQLGIVIGPNGWQDFYVRHELVHYWQGYRLGLWWRWRSPRWIVEGMAYTLSADPRATLVEPNQTYRAQFQAWYAPIGPTNLWTAARNAH